jgi:hypothetical protein
MNTRHDPECALVPVSHHVPARFESYPPEIMERAFELWSTIAGRSGARVLRLLSSEFGDEAALPTAETRCCSVALGVTESAAESEEIIL